MRRLLNWKAKTKLNIKFYSRKVGGYIAFLLTVLCFGWLCSKLLETIFVLVGYVATRFLVPKIKHFNTTQKCISISSATFMFFVSIISIPDNVSFLWNIAVGAVIPIVMYIESLLFQPVSNTENIIKLCKQYNYTELKTKLAIKFFVDKMATKDVWTWLCENYPDAMEYDSLKQTRWRIKKQLFK